ncbi:MAG: hypothetical protein ACYCOR_18945 [Acidobacteriaceae bacterium]
MEDLNSANFRLFIDGHPTPLSYFRRPGQAKPILFYFLLRNDQQDKEVLAKIEAELPASMGVLPANTLVSVGWYRRDETAQLILPPTADRTKVMSAVHEILMQATRTGSTLPSSSRASTSSAVPTTPLPATPQTNLSAGRKGNVQKGDFGPGNALNLVFANWADRPDRQNVQPWVVALTDALSMDYVWQAKRLHDVLLREGIVFDAVEETRGQDAKWIAASKVLAPTGISPFFVDAMYRFRYEEYLAQATGGEVVKLTPTTDYRTALLDLFRNQSEFYELEFNPESHYADGKLHSIKISLEIGSSRHSKDYLVSVRKAFAIEKPTVK